MDYPPERYHERRRRARVKRHRRLAALGVLLVLGAAGATAYALTRSRHVVVVDVPASVQDTPRKPAGEYSAAAGAQSLQRVKAQLAQSEHKTASRKSDRAASGSGNGALDSNAEASFAVLARSLPGHVELAVQPLGAGPREVLGGDEPTHGWSTTKVPVLVSLLRARGAGGLTVQERSWAQSAITESSNESVLALFNDLERLEGGLDGASAYMESVLRAGGDSETTVATAAPPPGAVTTFGQTEWSPSEAVTFFRALARGCLLSSEQTSYALGLMQNIVSSESWGLGSGGFGSVAFKGGWGPEAGGYLVRQSGVIDPDSSDGVAVAIVTKAPDFGAGTETLTRVASWLKDHIVLSSRASTGCAG